MSIVAEQIARRSLDDAQGRRRGGRRRGGDRRYQHVAQLRVQVVAAVAATRRPTATAAAAAAKAVLRTEVVVLNIGGVAAVADVVRVVHLHQNVARLQADLAQALRQVSVLAGVVLVVGARRRRGRPAKVHIVPERHEGRAGRRACRLRKTRKLVTSFRECSQLGAGAHIKWERD